MELLKAMLSFRSKQHFHWFILSLIPLAVVIGLYLWRRNSIRQSAVYSRMLADIIIPARLMHLVVALWASVNLVWPHAPIAVLSVDCVWFNSLLALVYTVLIWTSRRHAIRSDD